MSIVKCFNNLILMENVFGIYRNFSIQNKMKKFFIFFQLSIQTVMHTIALTIELHLLLGGGVFDQIGLIRCCFAVADCVNCLIFIVTGICTSHDFMAYHRSISRVSEQFKDDKNLKNALKKIYWFSIVLIVFGSAFVTYRATDFFKSISYTQVYIFMPVLVSQTISKVTVVFQHIMLFNLVMIVVYLFKCLTSLISTVQDRLKSCDVSSIGQSDITTMQIQGWFELYRDLATCCKKITLCFGCQFYFTLMLSILHLVSLTFQMFYLSLLNKGDTNATKKMIFVLFLYAILMMLPIVAGQLARNQGVKCQRVMARLYNTMTIIESKEAEAKLIKHFIRLIKKNLIEIKLLSKVPAGMYMLPVIVTFAVNYIIFVLQINDIV